MDECTTVYSYITHPNGHCAVANAPPARLEASALPERHLLAGTPLLALADALDLFHTPDGVPCITIQIGTRQETWPLRSQGFRQWLGWRMYKQVGAMPTSQWIREALQLLSGIALYDGTEHPLAIRVAGHDGNVYIDLGNEQREVVEVTADGWQIITTPPARFYRPAGMTPLPRPEPGGNLDALRLFLNFGSEPDLILMGSWLIGALRPTGPYPILVLHGEQDSAKSTTTRVLRRLIDPHTTPLKRTVRDDRDLFITASRQHVLALDNLSHLQPWLSDALCTISTGGGYATRRLFTDDEEINFNVVRPVVLNGIEDIATRGDFMDRAMLLYLPSIPDHHRREDNEFWRDFEAAQSRIFGVLLDAVSTALCTLSAVRLSVMPRMADFYRWAYAAASACGWRLQTAQGAISDADAFVTAYNTNRQSANSVTLAASEVAQAVLALADQTPIWHGSATELLSVLHTVAAATRVRTDQWPKAANALSGVLRRLAPNLRQIGVHIEFSILSGGRGRCLTVRKDAPARLCS